MFGPLDTTADKLRTQFLIEDNWETVDLWIKYIPKIVHASNVLLTASPSDLTTEIQGIVETILELKEIKTVIAHKADQLQVAGNLQTGELETN